MAEELTTKQFVDIETGKPVSNPVYIGDVYDAEGADAVLRLFGQDKTRDTCGRVGDYRITDDPVLAENHLWPDGSPIDPVAWPELHAYAARLGWQTDAAGHFLLPDLRGKYLVGADSRDPDFAAGAVGGEKAVALTEENNGPHSHGIGVYAAFVAPTSGDGGIALGDAGVTRSTVSAGQGTPHNNLPPYRAVYIQLRAKPDPVVAQEVAADRLATARKIGSADFDGSADITQEQIGALPNTIENQTVAVQNYANGNLILQKKAGVVCCNVLGVAVNQNLPVGGEYTLGTILPAGYRPTTNIYQMVVAASVPKKYNWSVRTDGTVTIQPLDANGENEDVFYAVITWIAQ